MVYPFSQQSLKSLIKMPASSNLSNLPSAFVLAPVTISRDSGAPFVRCDPKCYASDTDGPDIEAYCKSVTDAINKWWESAAGDEVTTAIDPTESDDAIIAKMQCLLVPVANQVPTKGDEDTRVLSPAQVVELDQSSTDAVLMARPRVWRPRRVTWK
jgi:hypothetical protein